ncbi:hypothetical protein N0V87_008394 [Didymella glomerata]|uniref:Heme haloperoxidase family profile domain-containing protein n=1 Tax=Didymella glomerata TaxID=749621 RepID=A0A9W9BWM4_9PLEO|nr:hypothetical protein N0V87_008394 [Didymella glomerata]
MKTSVICSAALFSLATFAFPANLLKGDISAEQLAEFTALAERITQEAQKKPQPAHAKRGFNADAQHVSTTGDHAYVIFGMGLELSAFLSVYSGVMAGDVTSVSIGGKPKSGLLGGLTSSLGLLGEPQGLGNSHNRFECDASPTRADLYKTGDPNSLNIAQFEQLLAMPKGPNGYDITVMQTFRGARFNNSIATNGHFFSGPFTHLAVEAAAHYFTYRFFANYSAEYPDGYLDEETLKSFEGVTGERGSLQWKAGRERIPRNWHRRPLDNDYGLLSLNSDALVNIENHPYLVAIGGNTGEPNTFTGVNIADLTGGVFDAETLFQGNNLMCFAFQVVSLGSPDILRGLLGNVALAVQKLTAALDPLIDALGCPELTKYDKALLENFPGAGDGL